MLRFYCISIAKVARAAIASTEQPKPFQTDVVHCDKDRRRQRFNFSDLRSSSRHRLVAVVSAAAAVTDATAAIKKQPLQIELRKHTKRHPNRSSRRLRSQNRQN